jgi:hypothetical protein
MGVLYFLSAYCDLWLTLCRSRVSTKFRTVDQHIESLQREMRVMAARMRELESANTPNASVTASNNASLSSSSVSASLQRILNRPGSPDYIGPTSAEFGITQRQKSTGESDGYGDGESEAESTTAPSPAAVSDVEAMSSDPLGCFGKEEALRLVDVYENNVGLMYPCIDLDSVRSYVDEYYKDSGRVGPTPPGLSDQDWFFARDAEVLKIILATALLAESHGRSERAALLADNVEDRFAARVKIPEVDMKELLILTLLVCSLSFFQRRPLISSPSSTPTATTKSSPGVQSAWPPAAPCNSAFTDRKHGCAQAACSPAN